VLNLNIVKPDIYFEDKPCDQGRRKASPYGLCSFSPQLLRRVETQRYNVDRPYGTVRKGCGYGCLIDIPQLNGAIATIVLFIFYR
jgi:hypothetical protein